MKSQADKAQKLFDSACEAEDAGDLNKALRLYEQVTEIDKKSIKIKFCIASVLFDQGKWQEAIKVARKIPKNWRYSSAVYTLIGRSYLEQSYLLRAERAFRQSLAIKPDTWTWVFLSYVLMRLDRDGESIACLQSALKLDPDNEEAHYNLGYQYRSLKQYARAEKHLQRAVEIDPKYSLAYAELGWLLRRKDKLQEAVRLLKKSIKLDPNYGWSRVYLGNTLWRLKKFKAADEQYRKLIEIWPNKSISYWCYGGFLAYEGNNDYLAESLLRKAIELDPKDAEAHYNLGKHLYYWNRTNEAIGFLKKAVKHGNEKAAKILKEIEG